MHGISINHFDGKKRRLSRQAPVVTIFVHMNNQKGKHARIRNALTPSPPLALFLDPPATEQNKSTCGQLEDLVSCT